MKLKFLPLLLGILTAGISSFSPVVAKSSKFTSEMTAAYCAPSTPKICYVTAQGATYYGTWDDGPTSPTSE